MALGAPTPFALPALSSSKSHMGGQAEEGYSRQADWKAAFCHCALEFPHQDASGDRPPSTLPRGGGMENQSPGVASELGHSLGLAFPMSRARISWAALGEKHKITKNQRLLGARDVGTRRQRQAERSKHSSWGGKGVAQTKGLLLLCLFHTWPPPWRRAPEPLSGCLPLYPQCSPHSRGLGSPVGDLGAP